MLTGKIKYVIYGLIALVLVVVLFTAYRMFFMFNRKKVTAYMEAVANTTADPNTAYKILNEMVQSVLKSQDMVAAVRALAAAEKIEKEQVLVETALYKCYSLGFLENPATVQSSTPGVSEPIAA